MVWSSRAKGEYIQGAVFESLALLTPAKERERLATTDSFRFSFLQVSQHAERIDFFRILLESSSMGQPQFVHLHVHTDYSLLDGACETTELLDEASRQKMPAVAITDHGNLFAAANFFYEASKRDVKPIIGCEVYVAKGSRHDRGEKTNGSNGQDRGDAEPGMRGSNHLVLLCESLEGYHNLIKLVSAGFLEGFYYRPRIDYDLLS